jgi:hypothetical protein
MSYFTTTIDFSDGLQVTSARLDEITSGLRLASDSADGTTITLSSGVLSVGVLGASNYGNLSIPRAALENDIINGTKVADDAIDSEHCAAGFIDEEHFSTGCLPWTATKSADRAVQADMQSETASHFVSPDVLKYHPGVPKAYGTVAMENGVTTITGGYNVTSATDTGGESREITMAITMANTNYIVLATGNGGGTPLTVTGKTTTKFTIDGSASAAGRNASFVVYGQLA